MAQNDTQDLNKTNRSQVAGEYRQLFDLAADPQVILDNEGTIQDCNQTLLDVYGYNRNELIGKKIEIFHNPKDNFDEIYQNIVHVSDRVVPHEYIHKTKDGFIFPVEVCTNRVQFNGKPAQLSTIRDITKRKRTREALQESEKKFRLAFESSVIGKALSFLNGPFFWVNQTLCDILEYPAEELIGSLATSLTHPDDIESSKAAIKNLFSGKSKKDGFRIEKRYIAKSGRVVWANTMVSMLRDENNDPLYTIVEMEDITARKSAEETNRQLRNYLANVINSMPSILVGVDPDGTITQWNKRAQIETGLSQEQVMGKSFIELFPHFRDHVDDLKDAILDRKARRKAKIQRHSDSRVIHEDLTIYPLVSNGVDGAVIRIDNVTEQVRMEDMMIQSEKMMSIGGLAAGMAHEINNPLAGIMQNSQVVLSRLTRSLPANEAAAENLGISFDAVKTFMVEREIIKLLEMIHAAGARAARIVQNMLSFARKGNSEKSSYDLRQIMENTLDLSVNDYNVKRKYDFRKIKLVKDYPENLPPVFCEESKIQQVFLNLLKNAAQALHEKSWPQGDAPQIKIRMIQENDFVITEIADNGPGMDPDVQKRIFEPFFTTKAPGKGTGLGLSVSYFIIVEDSGGHMDVISSPDRGTTFVIKLPCRA